MPKRKTRGNGQGTAFKRGSAWTAQITVSAEKDEAGKIIRRRYKSKGGFKTKREALAYIPTLKNESAESNSNLTFEGLYKLWSGPHYARVSKDAENGYRAAYAKCGVLWTRLLSGIKAADLQSVIDCAMTLPKTRKDGTIVPPGALSPRAKGDIKSLFSNMYRYAIENDYAEKNYAQFVKGPAKVKPKKDAFTAEERAKLWCAYESGNDFVGYILTMIYTGMRYGEMSTVKKENVFLDKQYLVGGIKTKAGIDREIPLCNKILPVVTKLYDEGEKKLLEIAEKEWYTRYYVALEQSGVRPLNPHCCRHTTATALAEAGVAPAIITAIMGHEDYATTLGYTHISLADKLDGINKI